MNSADTLTAEAPTEDSGTVTHPGAKQTRSLRECVEQSMNNYFEHLDGQPVTDVYEMVMAEVEAPMLEVIMRETRHNQTRAAEMLGINRGTLRKKLKQYGLL